MTYSANENFFLFTSAVYDTISAIINKICSRIFVKISGRIMSGRGAGRPRKRSSSKGADTSACAPKASKSGQRFKSSYSADFPCIVPSSVGESYARCTACESDFTIAHGGYDDVFRHTKSQKHLRAGSALKGATPLTSFFASARKDEDGDSAVIRAETLFSLFLVEHNIPISAADHASQLFKMFPGNSVAKDFACGRTKATAIIKACSNDLKDQLILQMKKGPFILGTDEMVARREGSSTFPLWYDH